MTIGERVVAEARTWLNTPFHPQASCKQAGADCRGLIVGVARECGLPAASSPYAAIADYRRVDSDLLLRGLAETMDLIADRDSGADLRSMVRPGDLLLILLTDQDGFRKPMHLAIYAGLYPSERRPDKIREEMIHAMWSGVSAVRATPMGTDHWNAVDSIWRWRA